MGIKSFFLYCLFAGLQDRWLAAFLLWFLFFLTDDRLGVCLRPLKPKEKDPDDVQSRSFGTPIRRVEVYPGPE